MYLPLAIHQFHVEKKFAYNKNNHKFHPFPIRVYYYYNTHELSCNHVYSKSFPFLFSMIESE
ncbi:hypothetical protein STRDD13_01341 [Streptococcus sp. DD13]|nr:hypothetical protein STRDD13_01341 [Streptococcus sp. DD13]